jgi:hypothetical protein
MAGPVLWVVIKVRETQKVVDVVRKVAIAAITRGYGAIFGSTQIGCWDPRERESIEASEKEFDADVCVSITDHPLQTSAFEIFRTELSGLDDRNFGTSRIRALLLDLVRLQDIDRLAFIVSMDPWIAEKLPRVRVTTEELFLRLSEYCAREADPSLEHGGDGVFVLQKQNHSEGPGTGKTEPRRGAAR